MKGLTAEQVEQSRKDNGSNELTQVKQDPLWKKLLEGFTDPMLIILLVALAIQLIFFFLGRAEWYEAIGILVAVLIANFVGVFSEDKQKKKASALKAEAIAKERVKVYRDNKLIEIGINEVVVGDLVVLQAGDKIPADGIIVSGSVKVNQATVNGESEDAKKVALEDSEARSVYIDENELGSDFSKEHYVFRGTVVTEGSCEFEVLLVGDVTTYGKIALEMQEDTRETPLKVKLGTLAQQISKFGYIGASAIALVFIIRELMTPGGMPSDLIGWSVLLINAISLGVVIICMAVPEGLPMMISSVLAMMMGKMMKDNVLVHKLNGVETAGSLNILFSDKTGTITKGQLSVSEIVTGQIDECYKDTTTMSEDVRASFIKGVALNNSAEISEDKVIGGNPTDRALMQFALDNGVSTVDRSQVKKFNAFDSNKKCSSVILEDGVYVKGAAEKVIARCTSYLDDKGVNHKVTDSDKQRYNDYLNAQASRSMRMLAVAKVDGEDSDSNDLTLVSIISIRDDVRPEARDAIASVKKSGVQVVMVTGDRLDTAVAIAKEAELVSEDVIIVTEDNLDECCKMCEDVAVNSEAEFALTSDMLNKIDDDTLTVLISGIRVVARAIPSDKSRLVSIAQSLDLVSGMTGDGVNDAPALKKADVGFAMGSGTEVAKEAGDITILDDNFASIRKAILYGRTIMINIRKFLIFQLSVNVTTVALSFLAPLLGIAQPFSIITILYINLVMDALAAIAYGCEPALERYMADKPIKRSESIITKYMASQIATVSIYSTVIGLLILLCEPFQRLFYPVTVNSAVPVSYAEGALLAFFMMTVIFNGFNARSTGYNILEHIQENKAFIIVMCAVLGLLVFLIQVLNKVAGVQAIDLRTWISMFAFAILIIPIDLIRKTLLN